MGNKKNDDVKEAKKGCLVLIALSVLILLVTMMSMFLQLVPLVVPAVFLILFIVNWYHYRKEDRPHLRNGFWLSEDDMDRYSLVSTVLETEKNNRNAVQAAVKNEGIHINQNGRISARSYRGKTFAIRWKMRMQRSTSIYLLRFISKDCRRSVGNQRGNIIQNIRASCLLS